MANLTHWFLTEAEKARVGHWKENTIDNSLSTKLLSGFWNYVVLWVPRHVAPNILTLASLLCNVHAYYLCFMYMDQFPRFVSLLSVILAFLSLTLDGIDGRHARITMNASPIGDLFAHCCNNTSFVFLTLTLCKLMGVEDLDTQWYFVQTAQLVFLRKHFGGFRKGYLHFNLLGSPAEVFFLLILVGVLRIFLGPFDYYLSYVYTPFMPILQGTSANITTVSMAVYYFIQTYTMIQIFQLPAEHSSTKNGLIFCLLYKDIPSLMIYFSVGGISTTVYSVVCDGLFATVLTSDMILAKMARRPLHPWVVVFAMLSLFHYLSALILCAMYYIAVFSELCSYFNLPMFSININVYVSGVFDLCHLGHMRMFENALKFGTRLYVGVCSDEDCSVYKRKPIMTLKERCDAVAACKYVTKVIPYAPTFDLPVDFLKKHDIHVVGLSEEYDKPDDQFYAGARELGIDRVLPRTEGMSTSELIRRIQAHK